MTTKTGLERISPETIRDWVAALPQGRQLSARDWERELRQLGLSKSEAARFLAADRRDARTREEAGAAALLNSLTQKTAPSSAPTGRHVSGYDYR